MRSVLPYLIVAVGGLACLLVANACNEALCAPLVSKCMLIKCCECDMTDKKNCSCCRACQVCLAKLYTQCCSCVGLCPAPDPEDSLYKSSSIETLPDPIPELFAVLTEEKDPLQRWTSFVYSYNLDSLLFKPGTGYTADVLPRAVTTDTDSEGVMGVHNCSTAFFSPCMSFAKCKLSCKSMGAAKYRWFHEHGCCQCIGTMCFDYGLNEPHCLHCPSKATKETDVKQKWPTEHNDFIIGDDDSQIKLSDNDNDLTLLSDIGLEKVGDS